MRQSDISQCVAVVLEVYGDDAKAAGIFDKIAQLRLIIQWLRDNGINIGVILSYITAIMAILQSSDDWPTKIQRLIELFFPGTQPSIAAPGEC